MPAPQPILHLVSTNNPGDSAGAALTRPAPHSQVVGTTPLVRFQQMANEFEELVESWSCTQRDVENTHGLVARLVELIHVYPEMCLGMAGRIMLLSPSMRHAFHVAVVAILLGEALNLGVAQQMTIARAALLMNLPSFMLQDDLLNARGHLTMGQRINVARHPLLASELLAHSKGADIQWIEAVEQHHESMDGTGYPHGLSGKDICVEARVLKAADIWCALVSARPTRPAKYPHDAIQELLTRERMRLDMSVMATLRRFLGNYPPGTLVRLASREIAVVTTFTHGNGGPRSVVSVLNAGGEVIGEPALRDTTRTTNIIRSYTYIPSHHPQTPRWDKVWSLA